jgi:hypothetical protein
MVGRIEGKQENRDKGGEERMKERIVRMGEQGG